MKINQKIFKILIPKLVFFWIVTKGTFSLDLYKTARAKIFHQVTVFVSDNFSKSYDFQKNINFELYQKSPNILYSFTTKHRKVVNYLRNEVKDVYHLQNSLIIFYTNNSNDTELFIDYLVKQLSVQTRPKCLIISFDRHEKYIELEKILKYAWKQKFLDFSIVIINFSQSIYESSTTVFYFNPFRDIVYQKNLDTDIEIFPDKLRNGYGYPFFLADFGFPLSTEHVRLTNRKVKILFNSYYAIDFATRILNFSSVKKKLKIESPFPGDYLEKLNLEVLPIPIGYMNYSTRFFIPADKRSENIVAVVPILSSHQIDISLKTLRKVMTVSGTVSIFLYSFSYIQKALGHIRIFDIVRILLGQQIRRDPQKIVERIIFFTVMIASAKIMNDFFSDMIMIQFNQEEIPFETYKDLYDSQLQTYTNLAFLRHMKFMENWYLSDVIARTTFTNNISCCFNMLKSWKNVSCITYVPLPEKINSQNRNPDGSPALKLAKPPIQGTSGDFYWFVNASPFAIKFLETMRRVRETKLMYGSALVDRNKKILDLDEESTSSAISEGVNLKQLIVILYLGFSISSIVFIFELVKPVIDEKFASYCFHRYILMKLLTRAL